MESAKEQMAKSLDASVKAMHCILMVLRSVQSGEPSLLLVFPEATSLESIAEINAFVDGGPVPSKVLAVVDLRSEVVTVMMSASAERQLIDAIRQAVLDALRANAKIGEITCGTTKPDAPSKELN